MNKFSLKRTTNGVWYGTFDHFDRLGVKHGISTRLGGFSKPPYASLNLGLKTGDEAEIVRLNRRLFCEAVGVDIARLVTAQQVHGERIHPVTGEDAGKGAENHAAAIADTDALISDVPGLSLMLFFADCVPVLIFDPVRRAIGVSHAGWKGTVSKIAQKTVLEMRGHYGCRPEDCLVAIGPSIGPCCYEVDETVINALQQNFPNWEELVLPRNERWLFDLWQANRVQLEDIGVRPGNIELAGVCTATNTSLFYSHRAEKGQTGRLGALIGL
ncbi:MAG TPA: peptidoglycan editing factor PgeF [Selenomonadales bacterium]|nr:peptidoglycan editing factor PgeF [Selenomonadales bacterium]